MGLLQTLFGKDYADQHFDIGLADPETGENLFLVPYADGTGADIKLENDPLIAGWGEAEDFASFVEATNAGLQETLQDIGFNVLRMGTEFRGQNGPVSDILNSGRVDVATPNTLAVTALDEALQTMETESNAMHNDPRLDEETQAVMGGIAQEASALRQGLNDVIEGRDFSIINAGTEQLKDMGFDENEIKAAMTLPDNVNEPEANTEHNFGAAAPLVP